MKYFIVGVGIGAAAVLLTAYISYTASEKKLDNIFGTEQNYSNILRIMPDLDPQFKLRIEELTTEGWTLIDNKAVNLTKEECDAMLNDFLSSGVTANRLRAVYDVGEPYKTPDV